MHRHTVALEHALPPVFPSHRHTYPSRCLTPCGILKTISMNTSDFSTISPSSEVEEAAFEQALTLSKGLFAHQVEGIAFLLARRRAILADDMGLGKTRQSILALRHAEPTGPYLVLCPASVKWNWVREIRNVDSKAECAVLSGGKDGGATDGFTGWVILNYDILGKRFKELELMEWKGVVFDEAHLLKNHESQRSKLGRRLVLEIAPEAAVHALTGTPLTNRPRDLFPLLQFIRHPLGRSFLSFAKRYCAAEKNDYGWVTDGASNLEELTLQLHGSMLRRRKEDVLDLPPKTRTWVDVEIAPDTAAAEIREVFATLVASKADDRPQASRSRLLAKITKAREKIARAKIQSTQDLAESIVAQGEKVIVFSCFDAPIAALTRHFGEAAVTLTGSTLTDKRQALVDRFQQDPTVRIFLANLIAGGVGLNLTQARHVVFNDLDWVPTNHWQAEDRAYRIGQQASVTVHYLTARGSIDEFVRNVLQVKTALIEAVVDGGALSPLATRDVLMELESLVARISPRLAEAEVPLTPEEWAEAVLEDVRRDEATATADTSGERRLSTHVTRDTLLALARVLARPKSRRFRIESSSGRGKHYELTYEESDVTCSCPGFEYRGACRHATDLKRALTAGSTPVGFEEVFG